MSAPKVQRSKCMIAEKSGRTQKTKFLLFIQRKYKKTSIIIEHTLSLSAGKNTI